MSKGLKLALLEDSVVLLKDLQSHIEENHLGSVVFSSTNSVDFIEKMKSQSSKIDALILDIDLAGDSMSGIDVANCVSDKPILFITGKTRDYIDQIETLKFKKEVPVEFMTKPLNVEKLINLFGKFEKSIAAFKKANKLNLKVMHQRNGEIEQGNIMFIKSIEKSESNNKSVQLFNDEIPLEMSHISLGKFFELGLSEELFIQTSQSCIVNKSILKSLDLRRDKSEYPFNQIINGKDKNFKIEVTEKYWSNPKRK